MMQNINPEIEQRNMTDLEVDEYCERFYGVKRDASISVDIREDLLLSKIDKLIIGL